MFTLKFFIFVVGVAVTMGKPSGHYGGGSAPAYNAPLRYGSGISAAYEEPYEERNYKVNYAVKDDPSFNFQTRDEEKDGKTVKGQYTVLEPTGELRIVKYIADENGFRADVQNQAGYAQPYPVPVAVQQPAYGRIQAKPYY